MVNDCAKLGRHQLACNRLSLPAPYAARVSSLRRLLEDLEFEIDLFSNLVKGRLRTDPGYVAVQQIPGIGPVLAAVFVAEIGDVSGSVPRRSWRAGPVDPQAPRVRHMCIAAGPSRARAWFAGRRWSRSNGSARTPRLGNSGIGSRTGSV
jgi:hypothetical protein